MVLQHKGEKNVPMPIRITEVGPRDGLQNEPEIISTKAKVTFVNALSQSGVAEIDLPAFGEVTIGYHFEEPLRPIRVELGQPVDGLG